jgi:hypothetical protein
VDVTNNGQSSVSPNPLAKLRNKFRLLPGTGASNPNLDIRRAGNRRERTDEIERIEHARADLALISTCAFITAMGTGADHITIRQEPVVCIRIDLLRGAHVQEAALPERTGEVLRQLMILWIGRAAEMIPRQLEGVARLFLQKILPGAKGADVCPGFRGGEFGGGTCSSGAQMRSVSRPRAR